MLNAQASTAGLGDVISVGNFTVLSSWPARVVLSLGGTSKPRCAIRRNYLVVNRFPSSGGTDASGFFHFVALRRWGERRGFRNRVHPTFCT